MKIREILESATEGATTTANMGIGIVIFGLGSVMISNALLDLLNQKKIIFRLFGVIIGAIIFRVILALALNIGLDPVLLKLVTAFIVLMVVSIPAFKKGGAINF
jgi:putative ABC transport system permease protein